MWNGSSTRRRWLAACGTAATALAGCATPNPSTWFGERTDREPTAWPMVGNGPAHTGHAPTASLSTTALSEQWSAKIGEPPFTSPIVAGDQVFVGGRYFGIGAFDLSGSRQWVQSSIGPGRAFPAVNKNATTLFVAKSNRSTEKRETFIRALDTATGEEQWRTQLGGSDAGVYAPTVANGAVYVRTRSGLVVLNASNGSIRWQRTSGPTIPLSKVDFFSEMSPAVVDDVVYVPDPDGLRAIDRADHSVIWKKKTGDVRSTPAVADSTVYVADVESGIYALDADTGAERWMMPRRGIWTSPAIADGRVYITDGSHVSAANASDGSPVWATDERGLHSTIVSSIAVGDGFLVTGSLEFGVAVLDASGDGGWFSDAIQWKTRGVSHSSPALANNSIYATLWRGDSQPGLYVYK